MINSASNNSPAESLSNVRSMLQRHYAIDLLYDTADQDTQDELAAEQDTICRSVVEILGDNMDAFDAIISALSSVRSIIENTYDHDEETGERLDSPGPLSGSDIVEMITDIEPKIEAALQSARQLFAAKPTDDAAGV